MNNKSNKTFLKGLKEIGCNRSEIRETHKKLKAYSGNLYRYRPIITEEDLEWRIEEIKNGVFTQPKENLNDPMDMYISAASTDYMHYIKKMKKMKKHFFVELREKGFNLIEIMKVLFFTSDKKAYKIIFNRVEKTIGKYIVPQFDQFAQERQSEDLEKMNKVLSFARISCFTDTYDNIPMWYSYASNRKGICLKYQIEESSEIRKNIFPVIYTKGKSDIYDTFSKMKMRNGIALTDMSNLLLLKTNDWSYEKEWRYLKNAIEEEVLTEKLNNFIEGKLTETFDNLPQEEKDKVMKIFDNISKEDRSVFLTEAFKNKLITPEHIMEFYNQLEPIKGKIEKLLKPCGIYLGDEIEQKYEEKILKEIADCEHIKKIYKMTLSPTGYIPMEYAEVKKNEAKKEAKKNLKKADEYMEESKYKEAIQECNESIKILQKIADEYCDNSIEKLVGEAYNNRGICHLRIGELEKALDDFNEIIKKEPDNPIPHNNIGNIYLKRKEYSLAIEKYKFGLSLWHNSTKGYVNLTFAYIGDCNYEMAIQTIKTGLEKCKDFVQVFCENFDFKDAIKKHQKFITMIQAVNELSKAPEFVKKIEKYNE